MDFLHTTDHGNLDRNEQSNSLIESYCDSKKSWCYKTQMWCTEQDVVKAGEHIKWVQNIYNNTGAIYTVFPLIEANRGGGHQCK
jgi:hypothetical protein